MSTGSLGQGSSVAMGMALADKLDNKDSKVYALLGDGELQEGLSSGASQLASGGSQLQSGASQVSPVSIRIGERSRPSAVAGICSESPAIERSVGMMSIVLSRVESTRWRIFSGYLIINGTLNDSV